TGRTPRTGRWPRLRSSLPPTALACLINCIICPSRQSLGPNQDPGRPVMPMHRQTALLQRLGLALPIVQAPMAGVSSPALAAAVSNAGGLGSIAIGASRHDAAREMIQ